MRKPRDIDSEMKALADKARQLKERRVRQLGELVITTGADALDPDELAGALLDAAGSDAARKEGWRRRGAVFFQGKKSKSARGAQDKPNSIAARDSGAASA